MGSPADPGSLNPVMRGLQFSAAMRMQLFKGYVVILVFATLAYAWCLRGMLQISKRLEKPSTTGEEINYEAVGFAWNEAGRQQLGNTPTQHSALLEYRVYIYSAAELSLICETIPPTFASVLESLYQIDYVTRNASRAGTAVAVLDTSLRSCGDLRQLPHWKEDDQHHLVVLFGNGTDVLLEGGWGSSLEGAVLASCTFQRSEFDGRKHLLIPSVSYDDDDDELPMLVPVRRPHLWTRRGVWLRVNHDNHTTVIRPPPKSSGSENGWRKATFTLIWPPLEKAYFFTAALQTWLARALQYGSIPTLVGVREAQLPYSELLDWKRAALFVPSGTGPHQLRNYLERYSVSEIFEMRREGRVLWFNYFRTPRAVLETSLLVLRRRNLQVGPAPRRLPTESLKLRGTRPLHTKRAQLPTPPHRTSTDDLHRLGDPFHEFSSLPYSKPDPPDPYLNDDPGLNVSNSKRTTPPQIMGENLPPETLTVVILTYKRTQFIQAQVQELRKLSFVERIIYIWQDVTQMPKITLKDPGGKVVILRSKQNDLNNRFIPYDVIETDAILLLDDDLLPTETQILFGFRVWRESRDRLVGYFQRNVMWEEKQWKYIGPRQQYALILTGTMFIHRHYLHLYTYVMPASIRAFVSKSMNCEDIAMNFLVSHITRKAPVKITTGKDIPLCSQCTRKLSLREDHYTRREKCVQAFRRAYGYLPLLYSESTVKLVYDFDN